MPSRSVAVALALCLTCAGGAVACWFKVSALRQEAQWHLLRANAEAEEFSQTLDSATAERQLASFEKRRQLLERSFGWHRLQLLLMLVAGAAAFASYLLYLYARLREQLHEAVLPEGSTELPRGPD